MKSFILNLLFWGAILVVGSAWVAFGIGNPSEITAAMALVGLAGLSAGLALYLRENAKKDR